MSMWHIGFWRHCAILRREEKYRHVGTFGFSEFLNKPSQHAMACLHHKVHLRRILVGALATSVDRAC